MYKSLIITWTDNDKYQFMNDKVVSDNNNLGIK